MTWNEFTAQLLSVLVPVIATGLAGLIAAAFALLTAKVKAQFGAQAAAKADEYFDLMDDAAVNAVLSVQQTFVDILKRDNQFTTENATEAKQKALAIALASLGDVKTKIQKQLLIDVPAYMDSLIEAQLHDLKRSGIIPEVHATSPQG